MVYQCQDELSLDPLLDHRLILATRITNAHFKADDEHVGFGRVIVTHEYRIIILEALEHVKEAFSVGLAIIVRRPEFELVVVCRVTSHIYVLFGAMFGLKWLEISRLQVTIVVCLSPNLSVSSQLAIGVVEGGRVARAVIGSESKGNVPSVLA